ncbi:Fc.00g090860.m01.CDS01 [Cosmosporella sp. VM-42]
MGAKTKVELIPWDPTDEKQFQRMVDQRIACGWRQEEVGEWKEKMLNGQKFLYWIVPAESLPDREKLLKDHLERYPVESEPLTDTATVVFNTPCEPSKKSFLPIGHIALELIPARDERFSLPASTIWIMSLYVSWALQASGLGRSAMVQMEHLATLPPLNRTTIALDTIAEEFYMKEESLRALYEDRGHERPEVVRSAEGWYKRQGYEIMEREEGGYNWKKPTDGEIIPITVVYMRKSLV